ncbi:uncharacterized protein At2g33490-like isoform X1 [Salvia miltiorrhiza]|uniref:uncharacterized protein At2g33490-like isoform X1 n=1 Tax=Salvia miltiorrhiza TaxID=226208 RepID=UPI0025ABCB38|nr:uncharacterized protein At2g33490-like isoform X1 [Salvia miltiorrhiza]
MKTSLKKLQKFASHRHDRRAQKQHQSVSLDEHARATQDMIDMRDCYDRLLSAAAATANSVYEFSESLREMGDCLLEKTALNDDEESGKVLLMLGKKQFELQKLIDGYRTHIFQTITIPSESLLNELRIVEEMKRRCDEKRELYDDLLNKQKEKARLRNSKSEHFHSPQLQEAHDEYDEEANVFVFRMKSLKQGQSRSFLTQASRHHAAQLYFFKRAARSLEAIEPHVRLLAEQLHIDYHFSGLQDDGREILDDDDDDDDDESDGDDDTEDGSEMHDAELSFDYGQNGQQQEVPASENSMELDNADVKFSPDLKLAPAKEILQAPRQNPLSLSAPLFQRGAGAVSKSAPLFPQRKLDSAERTAQMGPSPSRKFSSYVLPTPDETKTPRSGKLFSEAPQTRLADSNLRHSSPINQNKYERLGEKDKLSGPIILDTQSVLKESNTTIKASVLPSPLSEGLSFTRLDPNLASNAKKAKRQAFSGPLTGKPWSNNPKLTASGPIVSSAFPPSFSGSLLRTPMPRPTSNPKLSSHVSTNFVSSPKISELHELPRPPAHMAATRHPNRFAHSGPLISKRNEMSATRVSTSSIAASRLPTPPQGLSRSYSIPVGGSMEAALRIPLRGSQLKMKEDSSSPPPALPNTQPSSR